MLNLMDVKFRDKLILLPLISFLNYKFVSDHLWAELWIQYTACHVTVVALSPLNSLDMAAAAAGVAAVAPHVRRPLAHRVRFPCTARACARLVRVKVVHICVTTSEEKAHTVAHWRIVAVAQLLTKTGATLLRQQTQLFNTGGGGGIL